MNRHPILNNPQVQVAQPQAAPRGFTRRDAVVATITIVIALSIGLAICPFNCGNDLRLCKDECQRNLTRCYGAVNGAVAVQTAAQIFGIKTPFVESENETISLKTILDHEFTGAESGLASNYKEECLNPNTLVFKVLEDARALERTHHEARTQDRRLYLEVEGKVEALEQSKQLCEERHERHETAMAHSNRLHEEAKERHEAAMAHSNRILEEAIALHEEAIAHTNKLHGEAMARSDKAMARSDKKHDEALARSDKKHDEALARSDKEIEDLRNNLSARCAEEFGRNVAAHVIKNAKTWMISLLKILKKIFP